MIAKKCAARFIGAAVFAPVIAAGVAMCIACADSSPVAPESRFVIRVVSGDAQLAGARATVALPLVVGAAAPDGTPVAGVRLRFRVAKGNATLVDTIAVTGADGNAGARLIAGPAGDTAQVLAMMAAAPERFVRFTAIANAAPTVSAVLPASPASVAAGDTMRISGTGLSGSLVSVRFGDAEVAPLAGGSGVLVRAIVPPCLPAGPAAVRVLVDGAPTDPVMTTVRATRTAVSLKPYEWLSVAANQLAGCLTLSGEAGASYLVVPQFAAVGGEAFLFDWRLGSPLAPSLELVRAGEGSGAGAAQVQLRAARSGARIEFERVLRASERHVAAQLRGQGSAGTAALLGTLALRGGPALLRTPEPPPLGTIRSFTAVSSLDGTRFAPVTARLRFAGNRVLVYDDTAAVGLSQGQLLALARQMDGDLYNTAVSAFGAESDVDGNGRVIVLFTPVVNALVAAQDCVQRGFVTGFFHPPDLIERNGRGNRGEVFYAYVPDSAGRYSCAHTETEVVRTLQGTWLHELQHLISFNQHVLARGGEAEEPWLNEGLSQIAEELGSVLYERRYPAPLGRGTSAQLFPDSAAPFIAPQMLNAYVYLYSTTQHSVTTFDGAGSLEDRGAAWLFLRWLGDQKGDAIFRRLVESSRRGVANVEDVSGERFRALFGDFSLALYVDSIPGVVRETAPRRLRFSSRNVRKLMARQATISGFADPFPLATYLLERGGALRSRMVQGTMVHAIARSGANGTAGAPLALNFTTPELGTLAPALGAQVSILRLPP